MTQIIVVGIITFFVVSYLGYTPLFSFINRMSFFQQSILSTLGSSFVSLLFIEKIDWIRASYAILVLFVVTSLIALIMFILKKSIKSKTGPQVLYYKGTYFNRYNPEYKELIEHLQHNECILDKDNLEAILLDDDGDIKFLYKDESENTGKVKADKNKERKKRKIDLPLLVHHN